MESFLAQLMDSWRSGDEELMATLLLASVEEYPDLAPLYDVLITQRNVKMSNRIDSMIRAGGTHFVVVGALHVIGEEGIVATLTRRGFRAERINSY